MDAFIVDPTTTRDISELLLDADGRLRVVLASVLASTTAKERFMFGVRHGIYGLPTQELCDFLRKRIAGRTAIEIGAGHGVLAQALGIPATDSRLQEQPEIAAYYRAIGQPTVRYGVHVEKLDAAAAIAKYRPQVVIGSWITHLADPQRPESGGSDHGVDEGQVIAACDEYICIGNQQVHQHKPIWAIPHERVGPPWLYSRAVNGTPDFIACWQRPANSQ